MAAAVEGSSTPTALNSRAPTVQEKGDHGETVTKVASKTSQTASASASPKGETVVVNEKEEVIPETRLLTGRKLFLVFV